MPTNLPPSYKLSAEVHAALHDRLPVVALESTVITHGLPYPQNCRIVEEMEEQIRLQGAIPAIIAILNGQICVGLTADELERLSRGENMRKISNRDFAPAIVNRWSGGTTVAGTLLAAERVGLRTFATGGIGGVHRQAPFDISADLPQLARSPVLVVCAGAKAILDLPATLEVLETLGVPVVGYKTREFPAFYSASSGLPLSVWADSAKGLAAIAEEHWQSGQTSAVLVVQPPPAEDAIDPSQVEGFIQQAIDEAQAAGVRGQAVTPYLLRRVAELTGGTSLEANLSLLRNNALLAGQISVELARSQP